jgi:hypothetical protein
MIECTIRKKVAIASLCTLVCVYSLPCLLKILWNTGQNLENLKQVFHWVFPERAALEQLIICILAKRELSGDGWLM